MVDLDEHALDGFPAFRVRVKGLNLLEGFFVENGAAFTKAPWLTTAVVVGGTLVVEALVGAFVS